MQADLGAPLCALRTMKTLRRSPSTRAPSSERLAPGVGAVQVVGVHGVTKKSDTRNKLSLTGRLFPWPLEFPFLCQVPIQRCMSIRLYAIMADRPWATLWPRVASSCRAIGCSCAIALGAPWAHVASPTATLLSNFFPSYFPCEWERSPRCKSLENKEIERERHLIALISLPVSISSVSSCFHTRRPDGK